METTLHTIKHLKNILLKINKLVLVTSIIIITILLNSAFLFFGGKKVKSFSPEGQTSRETVIKIKFDFEAMEDTDKINVPFIDDILMINPPLIGEYKWLAVDTLQFIPFEKLAADTEYTVEIPKNQEFSGKKISGNRKFTFYTPKFKITNSNLYFDFYLFDIGEKNIIADISFNYEVDVDDINRFVKVFNNGKDFPYEVANNYDNKRFKLVTDTVKKDLEDQTFKLVIDEKLPNAESGTILDKSFEKKIILSKIPDFKYEAVKPIKKGSEYVVELQFNKIPKDRYLSNYIYVTERKKEDELSVDVKINGAFLILSGKFELSKYYEITIKEGLQAIDGSALKKEITIPVTIPKPQKEIKFLQEGSLLPFNDDVNLLVNSYDVSNINLEVFKVPLKNIPFLGQSGSQETMYGKIIYNEDFAITITDEYSTNLTEINLKSFIQKYGKGLYKIMIRADNRGWPRAEKWVLGTNMGLICKQDNNDLQIYCGSLKDFTPVNKAVVSILNKQGEELLTKKTDAKGFVSITDYTNFFKGDAPWLITATSGTDYSYLLFKDTRINFTNFDITGAPYKEGTLEAFVYPSRDLYKPGEKISLALTVRKIGDGDVKNLPVTIKVTNPLSIEVFDQKAALNELGMADFNFSLPGSTKTGKYTASVSISDDLIIGKTSFNIEEFIPQTLKVSIDVDNEKLRPGLPLKYMIKGQNLFGNPASGRRVMSTVDFTYKPFTAANYEDFSFENSRFSYKSQKVTLAETSLDNEGIIKYECPIPADTIPHGLLNAKIYTEVQQKGGRAVGMVKNVTISDKNYFLGVRNRDKGFSTLKEPTHFDIVALNKNGRPVTVKNVTVYIIKHGFYNVYQRAKWQQSGRYGSSTHQSILFRKHIPTLKGKTSFTYQHENLGNYEIIVIQEDDKISANKNYSVAGEGSVEMNLEEADQLKLKLDKDKYDLNDTAKLSVNAPFKGLLMISVEREKVLYKKLINMEQSSQIVDIPIDKAYLPNAYIVAMVFRSYADKDPTLPPRAVGIIPLEINKDSSKITLDIEVPDDIQPDSVVDVVVTSTNKTDTYITLSMVEEGVLNITGFHVPEIYDFFMRKRALTVTSYDTFSRVINKMPNLRGELTIGGGYYEPSDKHHNPVTKRKKKTIAYWSGLVKLTNGKAVIKVPIGNYNGSLRFMVVAASKDTFGSHEINVPVFAPYVIQPTIPRNIAPDDKLNIPVSVFNKTGKKQEVKLEATITGPLTIAGIKENTFILEPEEEKILDFRIEADKEDIGAAKVSFKASGGNIISTISEEVGIRPASSMHTVIKNGVIPKEKSMSIIPLYDYYDETQSNSLFISPFPEAEQIGNLDSLMRYPHGCLEQTLSKAFPQLYIAELAKHISPFLYRQKKEAEYIKEAIRKTELSRSYNGYELWPGYKAMHYLNLYALHFITEAKKKGYEIKEEYYRQDIDYVKSSIRHNLYGAGENSYFDICYGLYVLANANHAMRESMEYMKDNALHSDSHILSRLYLAGAYSKIGDKESALSILNSQKNIFFPEKFSWWGNPYLSDTAAIAMLLLVLIEIDPSHPLLQTYLDHLTKKIRSIRRMNTHEASMALQVYAKLFSKDTIRKISGNVTLKNKVMQLNADGLILEKANFSDSTILMNNTGTEDFYYSYLSEGYPLRSDYDEPLNEGFAVSRTYYDMHGRKLDLKNVAQGSVVVEKVTVNARTAGNSVIVVVFPGGLEIENPRIRNTDGLDWIPNYSNDRSNYLDIREDRILIFTDFSGGRSSKTYYFSYRAIFPGEFIIPYIFAEDMYKPDIYGRTESARLFIAPKD